MKTEETILNYMDGTLSEDESGELLHQLSVSPEKRVVLEQHIKLRELTSLAQKPVAVPQNLEASMAERFAAIADYNRELSGGAAIIRQTATPGFFGKMAASVAAFIAQYPVRTGFALAAASVIGYFALAGSSSSPKQEVATIAQQPEMQIMQNPNVADKTNGASRTNESYKTDMSHKSYKTHETYSTSGHSTSSNIASNSNNNNNIVHHAKQPNDNSQVAQDNIINENQNITPPVKIKTPDKGIADNKNNNGTPNNNDKKVNDNPVKENSAVKDIPKKDDVPKTIANNTPSSSSDDENVGSHSVNPLRNRDEHPVSTGFAFRAFEGFGASLVNADLNDTRLASKTEFTPTLGLDYSFSPNFAVGLEAGSAAISQLMTQSSVQTEGIDLPISRVVTSNSVAANSQWYGRAMFRYTVNPYDDWRMEVSGGGGLAFATGVNPLISGSFLLGHDFFSGFGIYGGVAVSGTWTSTNAQSNVPAVSATTDPIGYVTVNHAMATLFTPSVSARIGFKFKPW